LAVITALEIQKNNKERVNVFLDGEYAFSVALIEAARLRKGQSLSDDEIALLRDEDTTARAFDSAIRFLSYRPRSIAEVIRNLKDKSLTEPVIEAALERLRAVGYVDDDAFARFWVENRTTFKPLGQAALRYELRQKGVPDATIEDVLNGLDVHEAARKAAQERIRRLRGVDQRTFRAKIGSFLQRRGFSFDVTQAVISQLIEELGDSDFFSSGEDL
jgi:regulatory protein